MARARHAHQTLGDVRARVALGALVLIMPTDATGDGEETPMFGAAVVGARAPEHAADLVGVEVEAAWWWGRVGVAAEGSARWAVDEGGPQVTTLGASARLRVFESMLPSAIEPRDVELGIELHGLVERAWWDGAVPQHDSTAYGLGLAIRLRGGSDDDSSPLLAESRLFVRVMSSRWDTVDAVARATTPTQDPQARELAFMLGIGAAFGGGEPSYLERFRLRPFDAATPRSRSRSAYWADE